MLKSIKSDLQTYIYDDNAVDEAVSKMMLIVISIGCCMALGWWVFNLLKSRTEQSSCEHSDNPWCIE